MKNKFLQYTLIGCSMLAVFSSCRKQSFGGEEVPTAGKTFVWIDGGPQYDLHFDAFTSLKTVQLFTIRRDAANNTDLKKAVTISLTALDLATYNAANGTEYVPVPAELGTQAPASGIATSASGVTMNFAAGDFAKPYSFVLNGANFDPAKKYAMWLAISSTGGFAKKVGYDTILVTFGVKNIYDGVYHASGTFTRYSDPDTELDSRTIDEDKTLGTVDKTTVSSTVADLGDGDPITLKVNADNSVTVTFVGSSLSNLPGPFTQVGENKYDPATKTYTLHYQYRGGLRTTEEVLVKQ